MNSILSGKELKDTENGNEIILNGQKYHLTFDMNAMCELEDKYGSFENGMNTLTQIDANEVDEIGNKKPKKVMQDIRFILWLALMHDNETMTEREAGKLITLNNMQAVMDALGKAMTASMPEGGEKKEQSPQEQ